MTSPNTLLLNWLLALPFFAALAAALFPRFTMGARSAREAGELERGPLLFGALTSAMGLSLAIRITSLVARGEPVTANYLWTRDLYHLRFQADPFSAAIALLVCGLGLPMFLHLAGQEGRPRPHHRAALLLLAQGCVMAAAAAADLILLVFLLGVAVAALCLLVSLESSQRGQAMLLNGHLVWLAVLFAALLMWRQSGDTSLTQLPLLLLTKDPSALRAVALLVLLGLTPLLAGAPGYGRWMAAVKAAPSLAGMTAVLLVVAGGVALVRLLPGSLVLPAVPGLATLSLWTGLIVLFTGALGAWRADDLRGRAGWLTVAQAGYLLLALAGASGPSASPAFLEAAALHLGLAPLALLTIWLASLTVLSRTRTDTLVGLSGLFRKMPLAGLAWLVGGLSLVGAPPLAGFREQSLLLSAVAGDRAWALLAALLAGDLLIVYVVLDTFRRVYLRGQPPPDVRPTSPGLDVPLLLLVLVIVVAGVWSGPLERWADLICRTALTLRPTP